MDRKRTYTDRLLVFVISYFLLLWHTSAFALNMDSAKLVFYAKGFPSFLKITGEAEKICTGKLGDVTCKMDAFKTGLSLRDRHLREHIEVEKYPTANLKYSREGKLFTGVLGWRGVKQDVKGFFDPSLHQLKFQIDITKFNIKPPSFMGITVGKDIDVIATVGQASLPAGKKL